jgi:DNA replication initiation complex subunit (GINS family)
MTIKAHLKTELKRRTAQASAASATPVTAAPTPTPAEAEAESAPQDTPAPAHAQEEDVPQTASEATVEAANDEGAVVTSTEQHDADQGDMLHTNVRFLARSVNYFASAR